MTKELLKEIFETIFIEQVKEIIIDLKEDCTIGSNEVIICFGGYIQKWNIHELAYKCKEWANNLPSKRYQLYSGICPKSLNYSVCSIFSGAIEQTEKIIANSEVEAIIKATEWVLEELKNKGKIK